jgi:thymidylate synthase ThyX
MNLQDEILNFAQQHKKFNVADFLHFTKNRVTRPYCSKIFTELVNEKKLVRAGQSYRTVYSLPENIRFLGNVINLRIKNTNIQEHKVLENIQTKAPFILKLKDNVRSIFDYAFSEMLNNAIEHSKSKFIEIKIAKKDNRPSF